MPLSYFVRKYTSIAFFVTEVSELQTAILWNVRKLSLLWVILFVSFRYFLNDGCFEFFHYFLGAFDPKYHLFIGADQNEIYANISIMNLTKTDQLKTNGDKISSHILWIRSLFPNNIYERIYHIIIRNINTVLKFLLIRPSVTFLYQSLHNINIRGYLVPIRGQ